MSTFDAAGRMDNFVSPISAAPEQQILDDRLEMQRRVRSFDWSMTSIGRRDSWSPALKTTVSLLLANRFPMLLWWGPDYISIYNDAYIPILGQKHPWALGKPVRECWSEIWSVLEPLIDTPFHGGPSTWSDDIELYINRAGFTEETHFTVAYSPVPDETAEHGIGGVLATVHEITAEIVSQRRGAILRDLSSAVGSKTSKEVCLNVAARLSQHSSDIPFAVIYFSGRGRDATLVAAAGVEPGDQRLAPASIGFDDRAALWPIHRCAESGEVQVVELSSESIEIPNPGWRHPPKQAVVLPIHPPLAHQSATFLVLGLSSTLPLDESYMDFLKLIAAQVSTAISAAAASEEEHKRAEALAEIDRAKIAFFSNVSHEFRTPLTLMLGPLEEVLKDDQLSGSQRERIDIAHRNSLRLLKLVNSLLDFSRIEAGRMKASYAPVDLAALTRDLASNFRSATQAAGLELVIDCPDLSQPAYVAVELWEKIVLNLLSNAFRFTFNGRITVSLKEAKDTVVLSVADTGTGIPEKELPHIFERFHRVEGARGRSYEGSGIGLALVQELARLHGGAVSVESEVSRGTTFRVQIPLGYSHLPEDRVKTVADATSTLPQGGAYVGETLRWLPDSNDSSFGLRNGSTDQGLTADHVDTAPNAERMPSILLADDNRDMREYIARLLGGSMRVTAVTDGREALASALRDPPDLILSDVMMPRMDGLGLLRELRANAATSTVPVILISARAGEESRIEGVTAGAEDYLIKPFSAAELLARVTTHLKLSKTRKESIAVMQRLQEVSTLLVGDTDLKTMLEDFLGAAIEITGSDMGNIQLLDASNGHLTIVAQRGFSHDFLKFFDTVRGGQAACGMAMQEHRRIIVEDVSSSSIFDEEARKVISEAGVNAVQSTPFLTRSGKLLGMFSTHFRSPGRPADRDLQLLDVLVRQVTDLLERELTDQELRRNNKKLARDIEALTRIHDLSMRKLDSSGLQSLLKETMDAAVSIVGADFGTLQLVEGDALSIVAHAGHEQPFLEFFKNAETQQSVCGEAMKQGGRVIIEDVEESPLFARSPSLAVLRTAGVRAVQSTPLFSRGGKMLGILTTQWKLPHLADEHDLWRLDLLVRQAADVIESNVNADLLRASEERLLMTIEAAGLGTWDVDLPSGIAYWSRRYFEILGYPPNQDRTSTLPVWRSRVYPEDLENVDQALKVAEASGEKYVSEHRIVRADNGEIRWVAEFGRYVKGPNGEPHRFMGVSFDITERVRSARDANLLAAIVDSSDDAIVSKNLDGVITSWNNSAERLFGYTANEAIGQLVAVLLVPGDRQDEEVDILRRLRKGERVEHFETIRKRKNGEPLDVSLTISPIRDDLGRVVGASKIARDITENKRREIQLRESEERFRQLAEVGPQIVWLSGPGGELEFVNRRWVDFSGMDLEAMKDPAQIQSRLHPEDDTLGLWRKAVDTGTPFELEARLRGKDGEFRWFMMRSVPVRDDQGRIRKWFGTSTDIHESKLLQLELQRANFDLEQFAYSASHDLQEPLRSVKIFSELLFERCEEKLAGEEREFLSNVRQGATRMELLVRDLLAYTQAGKSEKPQEAVDANAPFQQAVANLAGSVAETGATIDCEPLPALRVHATQLHQLFQNLIGNALKYHRPGVTPVVHTRAKRENGDWHLTIQDNGIGIQPEFKEKIFGLFKRLHTYDEYAGTGIGLAICQRIVERHQGRIWVESEPGRGSTFHFTFPV
jgi:PAS domain S-box-containing protein